MKESKLSVGHVTGRVLAIGIKLHHKHSLMPTYATDGSAGMDLHAAEGGTMWPDGGVAMIPIGISISLPEGYEAQIRPRSGLAFKWGITVLNSPGTIDSDYRGLINVLLINHGSSTYRVQQGERIAQLVVAPVARVVWWAPQEALDDTGRGDGGFGSTGK